ncbi:MAG: DUF5325 family protein [Bacilli bacterium]
MSTIQFKYLTISLIAIIFLLLTAVMIGEKSVFGAAVSFVAFILTMGIGFMQKRRDRKHKGDSPT